jgi:UDP-N-acetylglucosamine pyrophosphorylase
MSIDPRLAVVLMAAGKGTRMNNPDVAKVMYTLDGKPMVEHVVDLAARLQSSKTVVVVGWQKESVVQHLKMAGKAVVCVDQVPQLGTGHAVMQAEQELKDFDGDVLVLSGDVPLLSCETVQLLIGVHRSRGAAATVLTALMDDPTGYGRIVRDKEGRVIAIVEHRDATDEQRAIREINSGIYMFRSADLFDGLKHISQANAQNEYYLTDIFSYYWKRNLPVHAVVASDPREILGINTQQQLEEARALLTIRNG